MLLKALDFTKTSLKQSQVQKLSPEDLKLLRGIIFGRHGRVFKDYDIKAYARHGRMFRADWLQQYFFFQPWYAPDENFKDESLSDKAHTGLA